MSIRPTQVSGNVTFTGAEPGIPNDGLAGQVLTKLSDTDFDVDWASNTNFSTATDPPADIFGSDGDVVLDTTTGLLYFKASGTWSTFTVVIPPGGTTGQVLAKVDNTDFNLTWTTPAGGGGGGSEFIVASSLYSPAAWVAKAAYTCDGTDDDVQIQQAIDDAATAGGGGIGGGTVLLAPGFFFCTSDVTIKNGVTLAGCGSGQLNGTDLALNGVQLKAAFHSGNQIGLRDIQVLAYTASPASGALVDFGSGTVAASVDNVVIGAAATTISGDTPGSFANISCGSTGHIRDLTVNIKNAWTPPTSYTDLAAVRIELDGLASLSGLHINDNESVPSIGLDLIVQNGSKASCIYVQSCTVRATVDTGGTIDGMLITNVPGADGLMVSSTVNGGFISHVTVPGAGAAAAATYSGITINADNVVLHDCQVRDGNTSLLYGLSVASGSNNYIHDCDLRAGLGAGNYNDAGTGTSVADNLVS